MESEVREEKMLLRGRTHLENAIIEELKKKSDSGSDEPIDVGVTSFKGRSGAVTPEAGDYTAAQVGALALTGGTVTGDVAFKTKVSEGLSVASGDYSHAEGGYSQATGGDSHAENWKTIASGENSHAEGNTTVAFGNSSHAEGYHTRADGSYSHSEGYQAVSSGIASHAEGAGIASGSRSHAEGWYFDDTEPPTASGGASHAEGYNTLASGGGSHAEGRGSVASGEYSHAEGRGSVASGQASHAGGKFTIAIEGEMAIGLANKESEGTYNYFVIGDGNGSTSATSRANVFRVRYNGIYGSVSFNNSGADYAEMFEWEDSNPNGEDRVGRFVTLDGTKIRLATGDDDFILGIVSATPSVLGDNHSDQWRDMFARDIFGRRIIEEVKDEDTGKITIQKKINPSYDPSQPYIGRSDRSEWAPVGLLGKLVAIDDGSCEVNGWANPFLNGIATKSEERTKYRVMERLDDSHIRILILS